MINNNLVESVPGHTLADIQLVGECIDVLDKHYPGHTWRIFLDEDVTGGVMRILNDAINAAVFSNTPYGYTLHVDTVYQDPDRKCVIRAGGEILERAYLQRGWNRQEKIKQVDGVKDKHQPIIVVGG